MVPLVVESLQLCDDILASLVILAVSTANDRGEADKVVAAHVLGAGVEVPRPGHRHDDGRHQVEVAAVLRVPDLHRRRHVTVAQQHRPVHAVHPHVLAQATSRKVFKCDSNSRTKGVKVTLSGSYD